MSDLGKELKAIIALRRDSISEWQKIEESFTPRNGEVCFIDTSNRLRAKVGNGVNRLVDLPYTDEFVLSQIDSVVISGYYMNGNFYTDSTYTIECDKSIHKIYVDRNSNTIYNYNGTHYIGVNDALPKASSVIAGVMKLYDVKGQNIDGTMTQKKITDELNTKFEVEIDQDEEMAIFSISI